MYDVLVVGAGHAGIEAALAAARMGCRTAVLTMSVESIGRMSCNPAIGGLAKGQMVREIDALGGEMGRATDATGIHFRMLNTGKGPAVLSPRAQCDKIAYSKYMQRVLQNTENLSVVEDTVESLIVEDGACRGVIGRSGQTYSGRTVVLTTGTFLKALQHCGEVKRTGGRIGEPSAENLSDHLRALGFEVGRLKTGTPPRLARESIDFSRTQTQHPDVLPVPFSHFTGSIQCEQVVCWLTATNERTHEILRANLDRAPMYCGQIQSTGPRYCPSVEDKVVRFAEKTSHQIFLEPESLSTNEIYCNGISTSMPPDVQEAFVRTIRGLERAEFVRYGYAVEYDYVPPHQLHPTLETKDLPGLFHAGQINGTSGYEEAGGQGIVAGINAALKVQGRPPLALRRDQAYIGVLIDDLISMEHREPYRMFTSRAEYRMLLRTDNADRRLMRIGYDLGLVPAAAKESLDTKETVIAAIREHLRRKHLEPILRRQQSRLRDVYPDPVDPEIARQVEIEVKYEAFQERQQVQIDRVRRYEERRIPPNFDYERVTHLRNETKGKLQRFRPATLGQAGRIAGVTPVDLQLLLVYLGR